MSKLIVCGSRSFDDKDTLTKKLDKYIAEHPSAQIVSGGARGADSLALDYAVRHKIPVFVFPANWALYGKKAGIMRNAEMLRYINGDDDPAVMAFWDGTSPGTANMIKISQKAGIPVDITYF